MKKSCNMLAAALLLASPAAQAADILGCFAATYDKAHLARYPGQTPTYLAVEISRQDGNIAMGITAKLRGTSGKWVEAGGCNSQGATLNCHIDCDGGGFTLKPNATGVTLTNTAGFRVTKEGCGEEQFHVVEAVPGNRRFALTNADRKMCE